MKTVILTTITDQIKAHMVQDVLKNEGIESILQGELSAQVTFSVGVLGIPILVFDKDLEKARKILEEHFEEEL